MSEAPGAATEDTLVPISALQHYLFCPRQCALIHVERLWAENAATMEGRILHDSVDAGHSETRGDVRIARGVSLRSLTLGVVGRADVVEFRGGQPFPVEYKRGKPKTHRADEVQLCAQAICLEEMLGRSVPEGALFYGEKRRRLTVPFDEELRELTAKIARATREMIGADRVPPAKRTPSCGKCSLERLCRPSQFEHPPRIETWFSANLECTLTEGE